MEQAERQCYSCFPPYETLAWRLFIERERRLTQGFKVFPVEQRSVVSSNKLKLLQPREFHCTAATSATGGCLTRLVRPVSDAAEPAIAASCARISSSVNRRQIRLAGFPATTS